MPTQNQRNFAIPCLLLATTLAIAANSVSADVTVPTPTPNPTPELSTGDNLVKLAAHHFKDMGGISPAEEIVFRRTASGEPADFRIKSNTEADPDTEPANDPPNARDWRIPE